MKEALATTVYADAARDVSYATSAATRGGRALIRSVELLTGRLALLRRATGYETEIEAGRDFWDVMVEAYGLGVEVTHGHLGSIPRRGPLILVANHPFGILDGLTMGHLLSQVRGDFRILAHRVFRKSRALDDIILPVNFDETRAAQVENMRTRKEALSYLATGGAIGVFPGGTVSTSVTPWAQPADPEWRRFTARMIARSGATVVPLYFEGANSRLFQIASHAHHTLRMALMIREFKRRIDQPVHLSVGAPIPAAEITARQGDAAALMAYLRAETYALAGGGRDAALGFEFEDRYRR